MVMRVAVIVCCTITGLLFGFVAGYTLAAVEDLSAANPTNRFEVLAMVILTALGALVGGITGIAIVQTCTRRK